MAIEYLGETFDLHGGGEDLIFPHHESEIAQSEAATGRPFVRFWVHNGFVNLGAEKMSKSLGNTLAIRELVQRHDPEAIRLCLLGTHYRNPVEFSEERVAESGRALERLQALRVEADRMAAAEEPPGPDGGPASEVAAHRARFEAAMDDDFNTAQALGVLFDLSRTLQSARAKVDAGQLGAGAFRLGVGEMTRLGGVLGLFQAAPGRDVDVDPALRAKIDSLVGLRQAARERRDFAEADRIARRAAGLGRGARGHARRYRLEARR